MWPLICLKTWIWRRRMRTGELACTGGCSCTGIWTWWGCVWLIVSRVKKWWWYNQFTLSITHTYPKTKLVYINCTTHIQHVQVVITAILSLLCVRERHMGWTSMDKHKKACGWDKYGNWEWSAQKQKLFSQPPLARIRPQHQYIHVFLFRQPQHGQQNQRKWSEWAAVVIPCHTTANDSPWLLYLNILCHTLNNHWLN